MADPSTRDVLTFVVTVHDHQKRPDLENVFIVRHIPALMERFVGRARFFHFVRHWVEGDGYGDSLWLRCKVAPESLDGLRDDILEFLKSLEGEPHVEKVWEPMLESDEEVFGSAPSLSPVSAFDSLWCFLDATCRTALNLLQLDQQGRLDVPEWVVADIWVSFFYNALGVPDFVGWPQCGGESAMRIPRCHACGVMPEIRRPAPAKGM